MIFAASWAISARIYGLVQRFASSNIVMRRVHTRTGIKWGPLVGLFGVVVYGLLLVITGILVRDGGPGWVNLFVLVGSASCARLHLRNGRKSPGRSRTLAGYSARLPSRTCAGPSMV